MSDTLLETLRDCLQIMETIETEYPKGEFDRELIHGEMDFRYRRIHELRRQLDAIPAPVRRFATLVRSFGGDLSVPLRLFTLIHESPRFFTIPTGAGFTGLQGRVAEAAAKLAAPPPEIMKIVGRLRMNGILDQRYALSAHQRSAVAALLQLYRSGPGAATPAGDPQGHSPT